MVQVSAVNKNENSPFELLEQVKQRSPLSARRVTPTRGTPLDVTVLPFKTQPFSSKIKFADNVRVCPKSTLTERVSEAKYPGLCA